MKMNIIVAGIFCLSLAAACEPDRRTAQNEGYIDTTDQGTVAADDEGVLDDNTREFVNEAASGGMMEVELGKLAQEKATNQQVKDFGAMMVKDHSQANEKLKSIAQNKNIQLPTSMKEEHQEHVTKLRNLSGQEFDKEYVNLMVEDHEEDISKFEDMQGNVKDQELKQWVDNTLPTLRTHKQQIDQIKNGMENKRS
jgi:putative membrane protein